MKHSKSALNLVVLVLVIYKAEIANLNIHLLHQISQNTLGENKPTAINEKILNSKRLKNGEILEDNVILTKLILVGTNMFALI